MTLFSYDVDGRVVKRYQYTHANGTTTVLAALTTTDTLTLDLRGAITQRGLTVGANSWYQWYDYDGRGLLASVFASTSSSRPGTADVTYTYRPSGQVASRQFSGGPVVPLKYSIRERLDSIGNPSLTSYPFSARYGYYANGTVSEAEFYSGGSPTQPRYRYTFGPSSYDALNRLKSADYSYYSGGWQGTLAYDLATINYDLNGNLTRLQRYRETGTLVDDLTKTIAGTSNRLTAVSDAISGNAETWDARSGAFTYDANGNLLTAPGGPYFITSTNYDYQNLPLTLTRSGTTTTYRYTEAGQRIAKQVGSGNREMYVLDGATQLGVVTVDVNGNALGWYWNLVAGDKVVGRQPNTGNRRYYHTDLLGSTRAVVDGSTQAIVESYDYDPWGVLMPGRTLGSGTKEGFTGKERDPETGLDYFGGRYVMSALGRWGSVDPLLDERPEWSPFNYTLDNPVASVDPQGMETIVIEGEAAQDFVWRLQHGPDAEKGSGCPPCRVSFTGGAPESGVEQLFQSWIQSALDVLTKRFDALRKILDLVPGVAVGTSAAEGKYGEAALAAGMLLIPAGPADDAGRLVIGKVADLAAEGAIGPGERTLLPLLRRTLGSPKANWARNARALRVEMRRGAPIRDASVNPLTGELLNHSGFLKAERELLRSRGWTYDRVTSQWMPPGAR